MRFLLLIITSFVLVVSAALSFSVNPPEDEKILGYQANDLPDVPVLQNGYPFPELSAQSVYAVDVDSGVALFEKNPDNPQLPASTAKIITSLVSYEYYPLDTVLTVGKITVEGQKMGLVETEQIRVKDLLAGLLIFSANDAAEVLAANYPGGRDAFISAMNLKARQFNLDNTHLSHPAGLDVYGQETTARDLARVSVEAMKLPFIASLVKDEEMVVESIDGKYVHKLENINELVGELDGVLGVKTGWTENARENLVTYIERDGRKVMITLLGSQDRFGETKDLINWIFSNYEWEKVYSP